MNDVLAPNACAVNEETAEGISVGRCWFYVGVEDVCPRHGNVSAVMRYYRATGRLTPEDQEKSDG